MLPRGVILSDYSEVIHTLKREKGLSLREIATWLTEHLGVPVSHTQVHRVLQAALPEDSQITSARESDSVQRMRDELDEEVQKK
jgi:transposase-like protein